VAKSRLWNRQELIIVLNFYCRTPFGRLHQLNPDIIRLADQLDRTPGAVAMQLTNFASFDPHLKSRGIRGLQHAGKMTAAIWEEFSSDWQSLALATERLSTEFTDGNTQSKRSKPFLYPDTETEAEAHVKVRKVQSFFRDAVLASYDFKCALCELDTPQLLNASHIIPWSANEHRRADPTNGISFCTLHDRAFDRGIISFTEDYHALVSPVAKKKFRSRVFQTMISDYEGANLVLPVRFLPDVIALGVHRSEIFDRWVRK
jgi:putative restriction endonuclease